MKKISPLVGTIGIFILALVLFAGAFAYQYFLSDIFKGILSYRQATPDPTAEPAPSGVEGWKTYTDGLSGISFKYPSIISLEKDGDKITLSHSVAYVHPDPCDFVGNAPSKDRLTDFNVSIKVSNKNLEDTKKDNFVWNYDKFSIGSLNGFKGESGIEGCGGYTYLFPISDNLTLVIGRAYITEFKPIITEYQKYLALPEIINPAQEEKYFTEILSTFKFINTPAFPELIWSDDLGKMYWEDAEPACIELGKAWRLPTESEIETALKNQFESNQNNPGGFQKEVGYFSVERLVNGYSANNGFSSVVGNMILFSNGKGNPIMANVRCVK